MHPDMITPLQLNVTDDSTQTYQYRDKSAVERDNQTADANWHTVETSINAEIARRELELENAAVERDHLDRLCSRLDRELTTLRTMRNQLTEAHSRADMPVAYRT
jgi:hypothetical protein